MSNMNVLSVDVALSPDTKGVEVSSGSQGSPENSEFSNIMQRQMQKDESGNKSTDTKKTAAKNVENDQKAIDNDKEANKAPNKNTTNNDSVEDKLNAEKKLNETAQTENKPDSDNEHESAEKSNKSPLDLEIQAEGATVNELSNVIVSSENKVSKELINAADAPSNIVFSEKSTLEDTVSAEELINMLDKSDKLLNNAQNKGDGGNQNQLSGNTSAQFDEEVTENDNKAIKKSALSSLIQQALNTDGKQSNSENGQAIKSENAEQALNTSANDSSKLANGHAEKINAVKLPPEQLIANTSSEESAAKQQQKSVNTIELVNELKLPPLTTEKLVEANQSLAKTTTPDAVKELHSAANLNQLESVSAGETADNDVLLQIDKKHVEAFNKVKPDALTEQEKKQSGVIGNNEQATENKKVDNNIELTVISQAQSDKIKPAVQSQSVAFSPVTATLVKEAEKQINTDVLQANSVEELAVIEALALMSDSKSSHNVPQISEPKVSSQITSSAITSPIHSAANGSDTSTPSTINEYHDSFAANAVKEADQQVKQSQIQFAETINIHRKDFAESIKEKVMVLVNQKLRQVDIRLDPPELGSMQVRVNLQNEVAAVSFVVQNQQAKEALEQHMPKLKDMLNESGVNVGDANVEQQKQGHHEQGETMANNNADDAQVNDTTVSDQALPLHAMVNHSSVGVDYYA